MLPRISQAQVAGPYRLRLTFTDGISAVVDLHDDIVGRGGVFLDLENPATFAAVTVDSEAGTVVWPNGVDFDPDVLYHRATGRPLPHQASASPARA
jgi:hypothetical protein